MWLFTKYGFFSVVCARSVENGVVTDKIDHSKMMIRSRCKEHLEALKLEMPFYLNDVEIHSDFGTDYAYRMFVNRIQYMGVIEYLAEDIDYGNFKSAAKEHGASDEYLHLLSEIWLDGFEFQERDQYAV